MVEISAPVGTATAVARVGAATYDSDSTGAEPKATVAPVQPIRLDAADLLAYETYVRGHQARLLHVAARFVGTDEADDILQEVLLKASVDWVRRFADPRTDAERNAYLALAVSHASLAALDKRRNERTRDTTYQAQANVRGLVADAFDAVDRRVSISDAFNALTVEDRQILYERYILDRSEAEVAAARGETASTIKGKTHRARAHLAARLTDPEGR